MCCRCALSLSLSLSLSLARARSLSLCERNMFHTIAEFMHYSFEFSESKGWHTVQNDISLTLRTGINLDSDLLLRTINAVLKVQQIYPGI